VSHRANESEPSEHWPPATREVYAGLQTYRIVGASACLTAILGGLNALAQDVASRHRGNVYRELVAAGSLFCSLKPNTAAYANAVQWLLIGLNQDMDAKEVASQVADRVNTYAAYSRRSLNRIVDESCRILPARGHVLIHDYSSTVLAIIEEAARRDNLLTVYVTAGAPVDQGPRVAQGVARAGHRLVYLPDTGIGRVMTEVEIVFSGVETLFRNGDLANTVGTYPMALVARDVRIPIYGVTERIKIHPTTERVTAGDLSARVLHAWPSDLSNLPTGTEVRREVLDLTPAELITGYVTEEGVIPPSHVRSALERFYAELAGATA
jgi:translation initiation factor 2B subunit (eIF-2B alpha/beta/delta family)